MERADPVYRRATRAYEVQRLQAGLAAAWPVAPLLALTVVLHGQVNAVTLLISAALVVTLVVATWRGVGWRRGGRFGLAAGVPALLTPTIVAMLRGEHCSACLASASGVTTCALACFGISALVGIGVGFVAAADRDTSRFAGGALVVAALTGAMACGLTGIGGAVGVLAGLVAGGLPTVILARRPLGA